MVSLSALWIPILASTVLAFVASSVIHMMLPWHKSDFPKMANEDKVADALRPLNIPPGDYMIPRPNDMNDMKSPEFLAKMTKGPVVIMTVVANGPISMGQSLSRWFVYQLVVAIFAAYIASHALATGAPYLQVFRFVGAVAFAGYSLAVWQMWIWYHRQLSITVKTTIDGLIYALLTAGMFGWLWPR